MNARWMMVGLGLALVSQGVARADDPGAAAPAAAGGGVDAYPIAVRDRPDVLPKGMLEIDGDTLVLSLSDGAFLKPFSLEPAVHYSLTDQDMVGLILSGQGICLAGTDNGCYKVLNSVTGEFQHVFVGDGTVHITGHVGVDVESFAGTFTLSVPVGARFHFLINDKLDALVDPTIYIGLANRDAIKDVLAVPVYVRYQATPELNVYLYTAIIGVIDPPSGSFTDFYTNPFGVGATYAINHALDVGAEFDFLNLYGNNSSADFRQLILRVAYRLMP